MAAFSIFAGVQAQRAADRSVQREIVLSQRAQRKAIAVAKQQAVLAAEHAISVAKKQAERDAHDAIAANNRRWCHVLTLIDSSEASSRPPTKAGRSFFADFRLLHAQFRCGRH